MAKDLLFFLLFRKIICRYFCYCFHPGGYQNEFTTKQAGLEMKCVNELQNDSNISFSLSIKSITFAALKAHVVKLADTSDLGSDAARCGGSSPSMGTQTIDNLSIEN